MSKGSDTLANWAARHRDTEAPNGSPEPRNPHPASTTERAGIVPVERASDTLPIERAQEARRGLSDEAADAKREEDPPAAVAPAHTENRQPAPGVLTYGDAGMAFVDPDNGIALQHLVDELVARGGVVHVMTTGAALLMRIRRGREDISVRGTASPWLDNKPRRETANPDHPASGPSTIEWLRTTVGAFFGAGPAAPLRLILIEPESIHPRDALGQPSAEVQRSLEALAKELDACVVVCHRDPGPILDPARPASPIITMPFRTAQGGSP